MEIRQYSNAEVVSAIKRLNDRFKQFEQKGYTKSQQYETLLGKAWQDSKGRTQQGAFTNWKQLKSTKSGYTALTTSVKAYTPQQIASIMKYGKIGSKTTAGVARKKAVATLKDKGQKATEKRIKEQMQADVDIHRFIAQHTAEIYMVDKLKKAVKRTHAENNARLYDSEASELLAMFSNPDYLDDEGNFIGDGTSSHPLG